MNTTWMELAKTHFSQKLREQTTETTETSLSMVSVVPPKHNCENSLTVSMVSEVCSWKETDNALNVEVASATPAIDGSDSRLKTATTAIAGSPKSKIESPALQLVHSDHPYWNAPVWAELEAALCLERVRQFKAKGIPTLQAEEAACRLVYRDRQDDGRRSCAECASFRSGRCLQGKQPFGGGGVRVLHRCSGFRPSEADND